MAGLTVSAKVSAVDRLADQIRDLIRENGLKVGDALPTERDLGHLFQAGRNTVREALQILRAYGMIETRPKVGAVISGGHSAAVRKLFAFQQGISPAAFLDVQGFRHLIEVGVCDQILLRATPADLDRLDAINATLLASTSADAAAQCDYQLHEAIVSLAGNRTAVATYALLQPVIEDILHLGKTDRPAQQEAFQAHAAIIAALRSRDRIAYAYLMGRHLESGLRFI